MKSANSVSHLLVLRFPFEHTTQTVVEATASKRAQAHRRLLRKVKTDLERLREQEKVKTQTNKSKQSVLISSQVITDAKALVKRYKKLLRR